VSGQGWNEWRVPGGASHRGRASSVADDRASAGWGEMRSVACLGSDDFRLWTSRALRRSAHAHSQRICSDPSTTSASEERRRVATLWQQSHVAGTDQAWALFLGEVVGVDADQVHRQRAAVRKLPSKSASAARRTWQTAAGTGSTAPLTAIVLGCSWPSRSAERCTSCKNPPQGFFSAVSEYCDR
jgi:hypothetical protein